MNAQDIEIATEDGVAPATIIWPSRDTNADGPRSGVILFMDVFGPRQSLRDMAARLAEAGHIVLLPDLFYRAGDYEHFEGAADVANEEKRAAIFAIMRETPLALTERDTVAFVKALRSEGADGKLGAVGYCMGGARALTALAACPGDIVAAASFHGGRLASDQPDSPHLRAGSMKGRVYVGNAGEDGSFPPEQSALLAQALREAGVDYILENYLGMKHGWAVPDHAVYDEAGAERHWKRLLTFFEETLK